MRIAIYDHDPALNDGQDWYPVVQVTTWDGSDTASWSDPVHPTYKAVSIEAWTDGVVTTSMWFSENTGFFKIPGNPPVYVHENYTPPPPMVPAFVSKLWLLRALRARSLEASVLGMLAAPGNETKQRDWDAAAQVRRDDPDIIAMATAVGLSTADIDAIFVTAGKEQLG